MTLENNKLSDQCHGQCGQLLSSSVHKELGCYEKLKNRLCVGFSNLVWRLETKGLWATAVFSFRKVLKMDNSTISKAGGTLSPIEEVLGLQPGEWVQIKSEEEIRATLDPSGAFKGLRFMVGMNKHCGKQYRVLKRLEVMMLESTGEYRKVKNTVLLEGAMCDGSPFNNCGRSCFFFWREAWLRRIQK